ncbi:splicing factor YJU2 isoform X2 [Lycorma delicatula]|uniref:splicing factor YJU2 isoform X2 n=1 Tax=Lycorma delicatula TaxID=130591 RepID=UPI003F51A963
MSERKVLNKYYPPDFDPSKIPRMKLPRNRQYTVRLMAPFNMRCKTCGEYIYKGKKFNARKEDVEGEDYLGIRIYRFYIKCTRCLQEISFKTDPKNTDYEIEAGATRNFMALKLAEEQAQREEDEKKEEEASNPMKLLENRTEQSKQELELLESLEELKDLNRRQRSIDFDAMLSQFDTKEAREKLLKMQEEDDERLVRSVFSKKIVEEEVIEEINDEIHAVVDEKLSKDDVSNSKHGELEYKPSASKCLKLSSSSAVSAPSSSAVKSSNVSNILTTKRVPLKINSDSTWNKSVGIMSHKSASGFSGLVRIKPNNNSDKSKQNEEQSKPQPPNQDSVNKSVSGISLVGNYGGSSSDSDS